MNAWLLWYDSTPHKPLAQIVREAAARFEQKFGRAPNHACVNPTDQAGVAQVDAITVVGTRNILRHHVWIQCRDKEAA